MTITLQPLESVQSLGQLLSPHRQPCAVALGTFDGVHPGHRAVIARTWDEARRRGVAAVAVTFDPRPERHFRGNLALPDLISIEERVRLLLECGIDDVVVLPFGDWLAEISPEAFLEALVAQLGMQAMCVGEGFHFGSGRAGGVHTAHAAGVPAVAVSTVIDPRTNERISSTGMRGCRAASSTN